MIDQAGKIYEGRSLEYLDAHVLSNNESNIGISILGDYSESELSNRQVSAAGMLIDAITALPIYDGISTDLGSSDIPTISPESLPIYSHGYYDSKKYNELAGARRQLDRFKVKFE